MQIEGNHTALSIAAALSSPQAEMGRCFFVSGMGSRAVWRSQSKQVTACLLEAGVKIDASRDNQGMLGLEVGLDVFGETTWVWDWWSILIFGPGVTWRKAANSMRVKTWTLTHCERSERWGSLVEAKDVKLKLTSWLTWPFVVVQLFWILIDSSMQGPDVQVFPRVPGSKWDEQDCCWGRLHSN